MNHKSMETLVQTAPSALSNVSEPPSPVSPEPAEIDAPPEQERPKLKRNFFHNWVDPADWKESDLARMNPRKQEKSMNDFW